MFSRWLLVFSLLFAPLAYAQEDLVSKRIIGGFELDNGDKTDTSIKQWPWIAALIDNDDKLRCGASLISSQWLMTAAHCLYSNGRVNTDLIPTAIFQQSNLEQLNPESIIRPISQVVIHPEYNYFTNDNDIALLKLQTPVSELEPIRLPGLYIDSPVVANGTFATVLGWGRNQSFEVDYRLRKAELPVADLHECAKIYSAFGININPNMLCAGFELGGYDACSGDSGGPLVVPHESGSGWKQIGIVSFGIGCAKPDYFGVYTRISRYIDFIEKTICEQRPETPEISTSYNHGQLSITLNALPNIDTIQQYRIYYAPYPLPKPIQHYDIPGSNSVSIELDVNDAFYVVGQKLENNCSSHYSEIITIR